MSLFSWLLDSSLVKSWVLGQVRSLVAVVGAGLIAKGYADNATIEAASGFLVAAVSFWMSHKDVISVDKQVKTALATPVPDVPKPSGSLTEDQEKEETKNLNILAKEGRLTPSGNVK